ncbi:tonB-system energizer ExbB [Rhizobium straminoryzae]|uniref:Biopolymer transport protein ExbB n=2 Tax=Rhizobium straminoryzae TaxID=1387186 RepID=A0A549TEC5_9HYPH|nr:tonB-system energizer ExbB [Rhizobium straminoryzae]TRL40493.1 tonB-system energizer ExbB [Rhizobium straminoryzae]
MPTLSPLTVLSWTTSSATVRKAGNETRSAFSPTALVIGSALFLSLACGAEAQDPTATQPRLTAPAISTEPPPAAAQPSASQPGAPALQDNAAIGDAQSAATGGVAAPEASAQGAVEVQASAPSATEGETAGLLEQFMHPAPRSDIPHDLSPLGMFMAAHWVVKGVMAGLALASLITWTVWLAKSLELAGARRRVNGVIKAIRNARTLSEALAATERRRGPAALMLREAALELKLSEGALDYANNSGVKERVSSSLSRIEAFAGRRMMRGTGALATIGSVGPFVGLFGTVWGIMNSFIGISQSQTTNLAVVAPGIAEALLATAIGLVAAIPAVVIYNIFARAITGYRQLLADAAAGVERLVSRDLDFRKVPTGARSKSSVSLMAGE